MNVSETEKISRKAYELPLLKSLVELGGASVPNDALYRLIAEKVDIASASSEYDIVHARPKWVYELQWVRFALVKQGDLDGSKRGIWEITEKGRERVRSEWNAYKASDYKLGQTEADPDQSVDIEEAHEDTAPETFASKFAPESLRVIKGKILVDDTPIHQITTILNASRHLILTGPPGTGKTTLALNTCAEAIKTNFVSGYILVTATSDWTTFDTIGGYMPRSGQELTFTPGLVLRSIQENKWLLIDEINRADIDKAFGPLLTILSGQDVELPFQDEQGRQLQIHHARGLESYYDGATATYFVGDNWRIIGTMNTSDKNSLFALSYAFLRRFGFVHVNNPPQTQLHRIIQGRVDDGHLDTSDAEKLEHLLEISPRVIGPAILIDILNYLKERRDHEAFFESVVAYVLPQFEGLMVEAIVDFFHSVVPSLDQHNQIQMRQYLTEMFEIESGVWV